MTKETREKIRAALEDSYQAARLSTARKVLAGSFVFDGSDRSEWTDAERLESDRIAVRRCQRALEVADMLLIAMVLP